MASKKWIRIPVPVADETDRRTLAAVLTACGLEVRIVRIKATNRGTPKRFVEYRDTGLADPQLIPSVDVEK